ncbi:NAD kinase [Weissella viridescens]|uniref:NAD kinase n=1 Tax=Weissella viridescens TaxID=1629 RepID=UPI001D065459|nr:NAD kinase [Weissella viridescens]MCB6840757.1 NAD kinase [Weissella viridescens]MCB6847526.1 NAD kinase [Weissella viridescens]
MKIAIYHNDNDHSVEVVDELKTKILARDDADIIFDDAHPDIVISVGGDGTLLSAFHAYEQQLDHVRFIGVHTGHLGFYADWQDFELDDLVNSLVHDSKESVEYPIVQANLFFTDQTQRTILALNEIVIKRSFGTLSAIVDINGDYFERFRGDGLSIATPSGSTAYNKAVGGAVVSPSLEAMQLTEIGSINNRVFRTLGSPVIMGASDVIAVKAPDAETDSVQVAYDTLHFVSEQIEKIEFKIAPTKIKFAKYRHMNFWQRIQTSFIGPEEK